VTVFNGCTLPYGPQGSSFHFALGTTFTQQGTTAPPPNGGRYDAVVVPVINDQNVPLYLGLSGSDWYVVSPQGEAGPYQGLLRPWLTGDGHVALRAGGDSGNSSSGPSPLVLWDDASFSDKATIACANGCANSGWSEIGQAPSASDNGQVVTWQGTLPAPPQNSGLQGGPGIYASIKTDSGRKIVQIAGVGTKTDTNAKLGSFEEDATNPNMLSHRVAVTSTQATGDHSVTVVFMAYNDQHKQGMYTTRVHFMPSSAPGSTFDPNNPDHFVVDAPHKVVQIDDTVATIGKVTGLDYWDPINNHGTGDLAFWVSTDQTQAIVRTKVPDRRPVLFIPGVAGSTLVDSSGREIWLDFLGQNEVTHSDLTDIHEIPYPKLKDRVNLSLQISKACPSANTSCNGFVTAPDVLQQTIQVGSNCCLSVYHDFLTRVVNDGGYSPYSLTDTSGHVDLPGRECNAQQDANGDWYQGTPGTKPTFFTFPYDWRRRNGENAILVHKYIKDCIQKFWPDTRINVLTHSMGGLLGRRYVLDYGAQDKAVNSMITIAGPWLGAPKLAYVILSGGFVTGIADLGAFDPGLHLNMIGRANGSDIKFVAQTMPAAHELAPSPAYQDIGGPPPLGEKGRDLNGDGTSTQDYTFPQMSSALKALEPPVDPSCTECSFDPGATATAFHANGNGPQDNQDNWTHDTSGIKYFHLYGQQPHQNTIMQTFASGVVNCVSSLVSSGQTCTPTDMLDVHFGKGDGTVPTLSATREGTQNLNAPTATMVPFIGKPTEADKIFDHNGMLGNVPLQDKVLQLLAQEDLPGLQPLAARRLQHKHRSGAQLLRPSKVALKHHKQHAKKHPVKARKLTATLDGSAQSIYLTVVGGDSINVTDADGIATQSVGGGDIALMPSGVDIYPVGDHANTIALDDKPGYTTTFNASGGGLTVIARIGAGDATSEVLRWSNINVPAGAAVALVSTQDGMSDLQYDSNGDGTVDTPVPPTYVLSGALANDVTSPSVSIGQTTVDGRIKLAVTATDASGIQDVEYSLDGTHYQKYTAPFAVDPAQTPVVSAFATDAAGNTGAPVQYITAGLPANSAPAVHDVSVTGVIDTPLPIALGAVDPENDPLTYTIVTPPAHGTLGTVGASGSVVYTPAHGYLGTDSFTYTASDDIHTTLPATVSITIGPDTAPVAQDASAGVRPARPRTLTLTATDVDGTSLTYAIVSQPAHGVLGTISGGKVTYTPNAGYTGPDSFTFKASDGVLDSNVATFSLTVSGDRAPVATGAALHAKPGLPLHLTLGATDADADPLTFALVSRPLHGTLTIGVGGAATYTSDTGYSGTDSFTWKANDGELDSNIAAVSIDVQPNRAPVAADATAGVKIGKPRTLHLSATDADQDPLTYMLLTGPTHGTLGAIAPNGTVVYTPSAGYAGPDSFTWKVSDGIVDSNTATQSLTVAANVPPAAADVSFGLAADRTKLVTLSATDADGDPLTYSIVSGPAHATLGTISGNRVLYTPSVTFTGTDSFTYKANDGEADSNIATVHATVTAPANNAPTLAADTITTAEDAAAIVDLTANDSDVDGDSIHVVSLSSPAHGAAILQPDGTVKYQPLPNYNGPDSFSYRACDNGVTNGTPDSRCSSATVAVTVTPVNDAPSANLDAVSLAEGSTQLFDAVANDTPGPSDEAGQHLALSTVSPAQHGTATFENGQIRYTPAPSYNGPDNFTYTICDDGLTNGLLDPVCSTGTVQVTVWEVNDTPVPQPDSATLAEDGSTLVNVLRNDSNGPANESDQHLTVQSAGAPAHGVASVDPLTGQVLYQPAPDYNGPDAFTYTACDDGTTHGAPDSKCATGIVTVTVTAVNDPPAAADDVVATLEDTQVAFDPRVNDTPGPANEADQHLNVTTLQQPQHGTASIQNGSVVYRPATDYNGPDSFTYSVCDDGVTNGNSDPRCATATVNVTVAPANDAPVPAQDSASLAEDSTLLVDVAANDSPGPPDEASQLLLLQSVGSPAHGTASVSHGKLLYIPNRDSNGPDSVTYTVCDNGSTNGQPDPLCATGTLNLSVTEANDPPQATNDELSVPVGGTATIDVLANDVAGPPNEASQTLTIQALGSPASGTATVQNGRIVYTAAAGFTGTDSLTYTVCDNGTTAGQSDPRCDTATVDIGVGVPAFNHTPQAHNGSFSMIEDAPPIQIDLSQLVSDRETAVGNLTYTVVSQPVRGTVSINGQTATYGTNAFARGTDTFTYKVTDGGYPDDCGVPSATCQAPKTSVTRTVTITIAPVNHAPTVQLQAPASAGEGAQVALTAATHDVDGDPLTYTWTTTAGSLTTNGPNATLVVPDGPASAAVHVSVSDGNGGTAAADQTIVIENVAPAGTFSNDGPVNDGQSFHLSLASITDPSAADTAAGFQIAFDCGAGTGYGPWGSQTTATCPTSDAGVRTVRSQVRDRDGGVTEYSGTIHVQSLAPDPTLTPSGTINEGQSFTLTVRLGAGIPSAKYDYAFDCGDGSGYRSYGSALTVTCLTNDNAVRTVKVRVRGHDGTVTEATATQTVLNVAPIISAAGPATVYWGLPAAFAGTASDPSSADTAAGLIPSWVWGDGTPSSLGLSATHAYATPGTYTAFFSAVDKDGGRGQAVSTVTVQKRTTGLAYTGPTNAAYGYAVLSAKLTDLVDTPSGLLANESVAFIVGSTVYTAKADSNGVATVTAAAPVGVGTFAVTVQFAGDSRYAASIARATLKVVQSVGTVTGASLAPTAGGSASFSVTGNGTTTSGSLDYANGATTVHATSLAPLGIAVDRKSAWFSGVSSTGQQIRVHVEDNGPGAPDVFTLWINGTLVTGTGALSSGDVQISAS
jgi:hypothetical protein